MARGNELPAPIINTLPRGLLSLFGIKNGGQAPQQLTTTLLPQVELLQWYFEAIAQFYVVARTPLLTANSNSSRNWTALGGGGGADLPIPVTVPQNELWAILHYSVSLAITGVAEFGDVVPCIMFDAGIAMLYPVAYQGQRQGIAGTTLGRSAAMLETPILVTSGSQLGIFVNEVQSGGMPCSGAIKIARMSI